jgi:hypothetical protein
MDLDLIDRRHYLAAIEKRREVLDHEIADPDRADFAVSEQCLQSAVGLQGSIERRRQCLVEEQQVDLVDTKLAGALLEAVQGFVVSVVANPDLRLKEDLRPADV